MGKTLKIILCLIAICSASLTISAHEAFLPPLEVDDIRKFDSIVAESGVGLFGSPSCRIFVHGLPVGSDMSMAEAKAAFVEIVKRVAIDIGEDDEDEIKEMTFDLGIVVVVDVNVKWEKRTELDKARVTNYSFLLFPKSERDLKLEFPNSNVKVALLREKDDATGMHSLRIVFEKPGSEKSVEQDK